MVSSTGGEFASYCLNRLAEFSAEDVFLRSSLAACAASDPRLTGWTTTALSNGFSTSFSRPLATTRSGNASFSFGMEMAGVVLKRSSFEVAVNADRSDESAENEKLLQVLMLFWQ